MNERIAPFDSDDKVALRNFLGTRAGQRLFPALMEQSPQLILKGETNAILTRTGEVAGFAQAIQAIAALTEEDAKPQHDASAYPSPEDDSQWKDGRKLNQ